jgi:hypothetical protein
MLACEWNVLERPNNLVTGENGVLGWIDAPEATPAMPTTNLAAWYDLSATTSLIKDSSDRIQLIGDKSGLSEDNALVLPAVANNYSILTTAVAIGTDDFTAPIRLTLPLADATAGLVFFSSSPSTNNVARSYHYELRSTGDLWIILVGATTADTRTLVISGFTASKLGTKGTLTTTRTGATLAAYWTPDGGATSTLSGSESTTGTPPAWSDTITSTYAVVGTNAVSGSETIEGLVFHARLYNSVLDAAAILADAGGTLQTGATVNADYTQAAKLATSFTASTGQTVTINQTATALPARIHGARDLYMGTASDQPKYLGYDGTNYGYLPGPGVISYFLSDTNVDLTGDIDLVSFIRYDSSTGASSDIISDVGGSSGEAEFRLTSGTLSMAWYEGGTRISVFSSAHSVATGTDIYFRVKRVNDDGGIYKVYFYKSTDGSSWTLISSHNGAGVAAPTSSTNVINVARAGFAGLVYKVEAWQGDSTAGGTLVADFNPADYTSGETFVSSATGETWTLQKGAHIVTRTGAYFDGRDHHMRSAQFSLSQPENVYLVGQQVDYKYNNSIFEGSSNGTMKLGNSGTEPNIVLGNNTSPLVSDWLSRTCAAVCALFNSASSELRVNRNAAAVSDIGTDDGNGFTLAARINGRRNTNIFVSEILIYDTVAHDTTTQDRLALYAGHKWIFPV